MEPCFMCLCFKIYYFIYIVDSLTMSSLSWTVQPLPDWTLSNTHIFSLRYITSFLIFTTLDSLSVLHLRAIFNSQVSTNKIATMHTHTHTAKNMTLNRFGKEHLLRVWEVKQEVRVWWKGQTASKRREEHSSWADPNSAVWGQEVSLKLHEL